MRAPLILLVTRRPTAARIAAAIAAALVLALAALGSLYAGSRSEPAGEERDSTITVATSAEPIRLDPHDTTDAPSSLINFHLYDRLVELDADMQIVPGLAKRWDVDESGKVWTLYLQPGVRFHDGSLLTAEAVAKNFRRLLDSERALARRDLISSHVEEVRAVGALAVAFYLTEPLGPFLRILAHESLGIISPRSIAQADAGAPFRPVGTGPFKLERWRPGSELILSAHAEHWRGPPPTKRLRFIAVPEGSSRAIMLETGAADVAFPLDPVHAMRLLDAPNLVVANAPSQRFVYAALNTRTPPFDRAVARRAVNYAVDAPSIVRHILFGFAEPADSPIARSTWGHSPVLPYAYDPKKARALLEDAGIPPGQTLELWAPTDRYPQVRAVTEAIAAYLKKLGFHVRIRLFEWGAYLSALRHHPDWNLAILGWVPSTGDADMAMRPIFASGARANHSGYRSKEVDRLLLEALDSRDVATRLRLYRAAQQAVAKDAPVLFLYSVHMVYGHGRHVAGIDSRSTEVLDLRRARVLGGSN